MEQHAIETPPLLGAGREFGDLAFELLSGDGAGAVGEIGVVGRAVGLEFGMRPKDVPAQFAYAGRETHRPVVTLRGYRSYQRAPCICKKKKGYAKKKKVDSPQRFLFWSRDRR